MITDLCYNDSTQTVKLLFRSIESFAIFPMAYNYGG